MNKCPTCGTETRPGDNFCLTCGNHLPPGTSSPTMGDATLLDQDDWGVSSDKTEAASGNWDAFNDHTIASTIAEPSIGGVDAHAPAVETLNKKIEHPARFIIYNAKGEVLQEYVLEKKGLIIGRATESDISFPHDMLVSRAHALISYEDGNYVLHDEGSANGTFVNTQQLEKRSNWTLRDGDKIAIGDQELAFLASMPTSSDREEKTMLIPLGAPGEDATRADDDATALASDPLGTRTMEVGSQSNSAPTPVEPVAESSAPRTPVQPEAVMGQNAPPAVVPVPASAAEKAATINSFASLARPTLPDVASLLAASAALEGQITVLQQQLSSAHNAMNNHESEIVQTANQLRTALRRLAERMDSTIAGVARSRGELDWDGLLHSLQDTIGNPRDIGNAMEFARRATDVDKVFQRYQGVLNTLAECNSLLRSLIGEDKP